MLALEFAHYTLMLCDFGLLPLAIHYPTKCNTCHGVIMRHVATHVFIYECTWHNMQNILINKYTYMVS